MMSNVSDSNYDVCHDGTGKALDNESDFCCDGLILLMVQKSQKTTWDLGCITPCKYQDTPPKLNIAPENWCLGN